MPQKPIDLSGIPDLEGIPDEQPKPEEQGWLSKAWHAISDPLTTKPTEWANEAANYMTDPNNHPGWLTGFGAGALQGIGNLASGLTSPLSIATMGMGGGEVAAAKAGLPEIATALKYGTRAASAPFAVHGAVTALDPNASAMDRLMGVGEMAGGAAGTFHDVPTMPTTSKIPQIAEAAKSKPTLRSELTDMFNEVKSGEAPPVEDNSIAGTVKRVKEADKMVQDFDLQRKEAPRVESQPAGEVDLSRVPDDVDSMIGDLGVDPSQMESGVESGPFENNASGTPGGGSLEEINRQSSMKANGQQFVVYDRQGNKRPIIGVDAQDYKAQPGETFGIENGDGSFTKYDDNGGLDPTKLQRKIDIIEGNIKNKGSASDATNAQLTDLKSKLPTNSKTQITQSVNEPSAIYIKSPEPEVIKQVMQKGYKFDSMRDDGAFKMVKSDKPMNLPVLESEVGQNRPTPANSMRMAGGEPPNGGGPKDVIGGEPPKRSALAEAFNFPRAVMASMDFSAPLRQGLTLIHKKQFWTSLDDMFKAWGSQKAYDAIQADIQNKPLFKPRMAPNGTPIRSFAEESGLKLTDMKSLSTREEAIMSSFADKIPGIGASNRAYTAFLNKLRADTFEDLINKSKVFGADGQANLPLARSIADFVNTASGRGSLGSLEKSAVTLNSLLFSPRLIASRLKLMNPSYYITANPFVRKEALKSLLAVAAVGNTITQLGRMAGGTVESDPASSDFGKLKIGNLRLDPYAGFQQYVVAASRLLSQRDVSSTTGKEYDLSNPRGPYDPTNADVITRFARGKLHPVLGFAWSLLDGAKEMSGQKMNFTTLNPMDNAIMQRFIPILFQDLYSIGQEDPSLLPVMAPLSTFGMGTQVYGNGGQ